MNAEVRRAALSLSLALGEGLLSRSSERAVLSSVGGIPWLDGESRADCGRTLADLRRRGILLARDPSAVPGYVASSCVPEIVKSLNRAKRREWRKTKALHVRSGMRICRGREDPIVFYLVSSHQKPQEAHAGLQGKVLIDRYWASVLAGHPRELAEVGGYVRANRPMTVQRAMGAPHYLIVRPNCRHYLIPVPTREVMGMSRRDLREAHNKAPTRVRRPISDAERYRQLRELESEVLAKLSKRVRKRP